IDFLFVSQLVNVGDADDIPGIIANEGNTALKTSMGVEQIGNPSDHFSGSIRAVALRRKVVAVTESLRVRFPTLRGDAAIPASNSLHHDACTKNDLSERSASTRMKVL